jgi:hypothetical protein
MEPNLRPANRASAISSSRNALLSLRLTDAWKIAGYISTSDTFRYCLWDSPAYYQHEAGELEISPEYAQKYADA